MSPVPYALAVDLGTTYTAAAIADDSGVRMVELAHDRAAVRSVVSPSTSSLLVGEEALSVAAATPWKVVREFKRRFGDPTPFIVEGGSWKSEQLMERLAEWVVEQASNMEGERPHTLVLTHPATWGSFKLNLMQSMAASTGIPNVRLLPEPTAAAIHYHERSRVPDGAAIAVYDLGGGTFDAAILERTDDGYVIRGQPRGLDHVGGIDFDEAVFNLVVEGLDGALEDVDPDDLSVQRAVARLREECTRAKVALSFDTRVVLPVLLPGLATEVMVQRSQFEQVISPYIDRTVDTMKESLDSAGITSQDLHAVLLVGGSSRLPMVSHALTSALGVNVVIDTHPKHAVAMGAALSTFAAAPVPMEAARAPVASEPTLLPTMTIDVSEFRALVNRRQLVVLSGPHGGNTIDLPDGSITLGRTTGPDVIGLDDNVVSRRHATFTRADSQVRVRDEQSTNGTRIDGLPLTAEVELELGSVVELGTTLLMLDGPAEVSESPTALAQTWVMPAEEEVQSLLGRFKKSAVMDEWISILRGQLGELNDVASRVVRARRIGNPTGPMTLAWTHSDPARVHPRVANDPAYGYVSVGYGHRPSLLDLSVPSELEPAQLEELDAMLGPRVFDAWVPVPIKVVGSYSLLNVGLEQGLPLLRSLLVEFITFHPDVPLNVLGVPNDGTFSFLGDSLLERADQIDTNAIRSGLLVVNGAGMGPTETARAVELGVWAQGLLWLGEHNPGFRGPDQIVRPGPSAATLVVETVGEQVVFLPCGIADDVVIDS